MNKNNLEFNIIEYILMELSKKENSKEYLLNEKA